MCVEATASPAHPHAPVAAASVKTFIFRRVSTRTSPSRHRPTRRPRIHAYMPPGMKFLRGTRRPVGVFVSEEKKNLLWKLGLPGAVVAALVAVLITEPGKALVARIFSPDRARNAEANRVLDEHIAVLERLSQLLDSSISVLEGARKKDTATLSRLEKRLLDENAVYSKEYYTIMSEIPIVRLYFDSATAALDSSAMEIILSGLNSASVVATSLSGRYRVIDTVPEERLKSGLPTDELRNARARVRYLRSLRK
jgi:hypothetical protein